MKREEFVFIIGFQGDSAIVDGQAMKKYGKLGTRELAEAGQFRAALRSAIFSNDQTEADFLVAHYNKVSGSDLHDITDLQKLLGVYQTADHKYKSKVV